MKKQTAQLIFDGGKNGKLLEAIADVVGKDIKIHRTGENTAADVVVCGDSKCILSPRISDSDEQKQGPWEMSYAIGDNGRVAWVWLGHKLLGPCYQRGTDGKWVNCYSHGNFGKNFSSGGNWSSSPFRIEGKTDHLKYDTLDECIQGRIDEIERAKISNNASDKIFLHYAAIPAIQPELI